MIELPGVITSQASNPRSEILHRETKRIKHKRNIIDSGEPTDRDKVFDKFGGNEDVVEV